MTTPTSDSAQGKSTRSTTPKPAESVVGFHHILSDDGTRLRAWTNDPMGRIDGPTVLLCNGLGVSPWTWPALLHADCGVRVVSWNHRGTGGSARPEDPMRVGIEEFVEDALSVMDHFGVDRAVVMGWSMGVNTAFELALRHPERVTGIFAVAGVPGDTFATMLGPLRLPHGVARNLTVSLSRLMLAAGRAISPVTTRLPVGTPHGGRPDPLRLHAAHAGQRADGPGACASSSASRWSGTSTSRCAPPSTPASRCAASRSR